MSDTDEQLLTYDEAARMLGIQVSTIKQLVYRKVLFSERVAGSQQKYLTRAQIEWYARRRDGAETGPNPYLTVRTANQAEAELNAIKPLQALAAADASPEFSSFALILLVILLLLAIIANKQPDKERLEELRTAPQLQPLRRAILKLAGEIAA